MTLRLTLLVDSSSVPVWIEGLAARLADLSRVQVSFRVHAEKKSQPNRILENYLRLERRFLHDIPDLTRRVEVKVDSASESQPDILISFLDSPVNESARLGTWMWNNISASAGFHEVLNRVPLTTCTLFAQLPGGEKKEIRRAVFATDWFSAARNRNRIYIRASTTLIWAVRKLMLHGEQNLFQPMTDTPEPRREVNALHIASLAVKQAARALEKKTRPQETWVVFAEKVEEQLIPNANQKQLIPPQGTYWADPLAFEREGKTYLFVEEYIRETKRGRIVCLTLDENAKVTSHQVALERPYHLSYPFIFEHRGGIYMIPETASRRAIEVYRCENFPDRWEFVTTLMDNVYAVDTTLLNHGGRWWLFANMLTEKGASSWDELYLFSSDDPLSKDWAPHPLNPIISDARLARPAGPFFTLDGKLYRPSQDSSQRYGYAVNLNRVDVLTESDYAETCVEKILPQSGFLTTHTYSRAGGWVFTDGVTRKLKEVE